jgi:DNA primase large subunit
VTMAFNVLIGDISNQFFERYPEHKGRVKFDQLNNQKRKFKVIFSIHRTLPFAVIPLDPEHIKIDLGKAKLPLSLEVLAEGERWYQSYDLSEKETLEKLLTPYVEQAKEELRERKARTGNYGIPRFRKPIPLEKWPPCMKNILQKAAPGCGPHRALAVLAAYLYQAGWPEDEAFKLWETVAERAGVEARIFDQWYGLMSCPNCRTIQRQSHGYPRVGLGGLGYCVGGC